MNSLRDHDDRIGRIIFHIKGVQGSVVITEGIDDVFVLQGVLRRNQILDVAGRPNVLRIGDELHARGVRRFVAVFDRDFCGEDYSAVSHMHPYFENDLESMLVEMGLLADLLAVRGQSEKIESRGGVHAVIERLRECVVPVAQLRRANAERGWGLNFDECDLAKFIDQKTLKLNVDRFASSLYNNRLRSDSFEDPPESAEIIAAAQLPATEKLIRGKDLLVAAGVSLRHYIGNLSKGQADAASLIASIHLAGKHALVSSEWASSLQSRLEDRAA